MQRDEFQPRREMEKLAVLGLLKVLHEGSLRYYQANTDRPIYEELQGITDLIREALQPLNPE